MRAALMRQRITINQPGTTGQDGFGQPIDGVAGDKVLCTWAQIAAVTSREVYALGAGFDGQVTHKVTIRWISTPLIAGMTVQYGARTFRVQAVSDPTETRRELDLLCLEESK